VGQAFATEAIAECIRSCGVWEAESNIELLDLVSTPAAADRDAPLTVECIKIYETAAKALRWNREFDQMREVLFVREAGDLALATSHFAQSSSASRLTAGAAGFLLLSQCRERPERQGEPSRFDTMWRTCPRTRSRHRTWQGPLRARSSLA